VTAAATVAFRAGTPADRAAVVRLFAAAYADSAVGRRLVSHPATLTGLSRTALIRHCAGPPPVTPTDVATATRYTLRRLAQRIQALTAEEPDLQQQITAVLNTHAPQVLQRHGAGPDSAAALLITARDNPDRMQRSLLRRPLRRQPHRGIPGKTRRRHLNRGGDRRANAALYPIALTRSRGDHCTGDYLDCRANQGLTRREAIRCLKRYTAREIYQLIH
jgi:hypothetical protein